MALGTISRLRSWFTAHLVVIATLLAGSPASNAQEIGFIEDFSLAQDRGKALEQLIPGTDDYYYYQCLHHQNNQQHDRVEQLLADWIKRHNVTPRVREIQHRQALLTYNQHPRKSLAYLQSQLSLHFNHQRDTVDRAAQLVTRLDQNLISRDRLTQAALQRHRNTLNGFEDSALEWLAYKTLDASRRRDLLKRLQRPDVDGLSGLVVADLNTRNSSGFGSFQIHRNLLKKQLDECLELKPALRNQTEFVNVYLNKLRPSPDVNMQFDSEARKAFLDRMWDFVKTLSPSHNSLKAHVLYHQLAVDETQGRHDSDKFLTYIKLPRPVDYINRKYLDQPGHQQNRVNLGADFRAVTQFPPIGSDRELVSRYLQHFFVDADNYRAYLPYLNDIFLKHLFAETKIVNGLGDPQKWYSLLPPDAYQRLKERVDLDFARTNPRHLSANASVSLDVDIKHVPNLIVKVYRINSLNFFKDRARDVDTGISLDGLIPNQELSFQYDDPPLRRVRRRFEFESLVKPGLYVIDFIGNGKSSRALVQKGKLRHVVHSTSAGLVFVVFDEDCHRLTDASLWMGGREYRANANGEIVVPYSTKPGGQQVILTHDKTVTLTTFQHLAESYALDVGFFVERESLLNGRIAKLLVRPGLFLNQHPVGLALIENARLEIASTDQDGVVSTDTISSIELKDSVDYVHEFRVPPRLASISVSLHGQVKSISENKNIDLHAHDSFSVNAIDKSFRIEDLHFSHADSGHFLDLLGKTGEPRHNRPVQLQFKHRDFRDLVTVTLRTNEAGRIELGSLEEIAWFKAQLPDGTNRQWYLRHDQHSYYSAVNGIVGEDIVLPYAGSADEPDREDLSLLETRHGQFVADRFDAISIKDGQLILQDLAAGDYLLTLKPLSRRIHVRITDGTQEAGYALGQFRQLELRGKRPVSIESIGVNAETIDIQLANASKFARVHVFATNYQPAFDVYSQLAKVHDAEPVFRDRVPSSCLYVEGRRIGDEYRYILDRKYAQKYPGNLLPRPELLLNPWAIRDTKTETETLARDEAFEAEAPPAEDADAQAEGRSGQAATAADSSDLNFLADAAFVRLNAKPNDDGRIQVKREELNGKQAVFVVAVDPLTTSVKFVALPEAPSKYLDLRLAGGLGPKGRFSQQKQIAFVNKGDLFKVEDIRSGKFELYDALPRVFQLYQTLTPTPQLNEFRFVLRWDRMPDDEKRELYSKYACHELNFFIQRKDPEFFDAVIQPYLRHKLNKTFLDHYLLGNDLTAFLSPWHYDRLNVVERILLARRIAGEQPVTAVSLANAAKLIPPDMDNFNRLFDTAITGQALSADGSVLSGVTGGIAFSRGAQVRTSSEALKTDASSGWATYSGRRMLEKRPQAAAATAAADKLGDDLAPREGNADYAEFQFDMAERRKNALTQRLYQTLDKTREWVENNYYQLPIDQQNQNLVEVNSFWVEFARHDASQPFYSTKLAEASRNFTEMMFALAVLDLPFEAPEHETNLDDMTLAITSGGPMIVYHQQIQPTTTVEDASPLLVSQNFFQHGDRYRQVDNQRVDKFVTDEFLAQTVYGCQIVVTNPTSTLQQLDVLVQIPQGAIPVHDGKVTRNVNLRLEPYRTHAFEYYFYFPADGEFEQFPVNVAQGQTLVASASPAAFNVVQELTQIDRQSWEYISQFGTDDEVLKYLKDENLYAIRLDRIAFRMSDFNFYQKATGVLKRRHAYDQTLWSYAIKHNEPEQVNEYLQHADGFVSQCGSLLTSPLLTISPVARHTYEHMEYRPLVNARAHQVGKRRQILNERLNAQYHRWLKLLSYVRELNEQDRLATVYYLLTQDRIADSLNQFKQIDPAQLATRMQYDYCSAYLSLLTGDLEKARSVSNRYSDYPVGRWRDAFALVRNQLDENGGKPIGLVDDADRNQVQENLAAAQPTFEFSVEAKTIGLNYSNLDQVQINYYLMDIELLFSRSPFVQKYTEQFSYIQPNLTQTVDLPGDQANAKIQLPESLQNQNVLVEIEAAGQRQSNAYYSNSIALQVSENYGQLRVADQASNRPLPTTYVKVYAQMKDGRVSFYKDGYTDLRGRFDYTSLSTNTLDHVNKFSILILNDEAGALVREANPPKR